MLGGFAVLIRDELQFSEAALGVAVATFFAAAAGGSAPAGRLADRIGARHALQLGLGAAAAALLAMTVATSWWQLTAALAVAGAGHAVLQVGSNLLLANDVPATMQGLAFGIKQSAVPLATLLAGVAVPVIGTQFGWRAAYGGAAAAALAILAINRRLRRRPSSARPPRPGNSGAAPFTRPELRALALAVAFGAASANALAAFLVEYAVSIGVPVGRAGVLLATASALGLVARIVIGRIADLHPSADLIAVAGLLTAGTVAFAALPAAGSGSALLWAGAAVGFAGGWGWPGLFTFIVARQNSTEPATATGVTQTGIFAGAVAGPLLFGLAVSASSYQLAWHGAAVAQLTGAVLVLVARRRWRRRTNPI